MDVAGRVTPPMTRPIAAPFAAWLGPDHFPASRSGLIGRAHAEGAPGWLLALLRSLPPDGHYYRDLDQLVDVLTPGDALTTPAISSRPSRPMITR